MTGAYGGIEWRAWMSLLMGPIASIKAEVEGSVLTLEVRDAQGQLVIQQRGPVRIHVDEGRLADRTQRSAGMTDLSDVDRLVCEVDIVHALNHDRGPDRMNLTRDCPEKLCRAATAVRYADRTSAECQFTGGEPCPCGASPKSCPAEAYTDDR